MMYKSIAACCTSSNLFIFLISDSLNRISARILCGCSSTLLFLFSYIIRWGISGNWIWSSLWMATSANFRSYRGRKLCWLVLRSLRNSFFCCLKISNLLGIYDQLFLSIFSLQWRKTFLRLVIVIFRLVHFIF